MEKLYPIQYEFIHVQCSWCQVPRLQNQNNDDHIGLNHMIYRINVWKTKPKWRKKKRKISNAKPTNERTQIARHLIDHLLVLDFSMKCKWRQRKEQDKNTQLECYTHSHAPLFGAFSLKQRRNCSCCFTHMR